MSNQAANYPQWCGHPFEVHGIKHLCAAQKGHEGGHIAFTNEMVRVTEKPAPVRSVEACDQPEIVHDSSGNVFADLGLPNAEALKAHSHPSLQESGDADPFHAIWDDVQSHYLQYLDTRKDPPEFYKACAHVAHRLTLARHSVLANIHGGLEFSHSCQHEATEFLERAASGDAGDYDACHSKVAEWLKAESRKSPEPPAGPAFEEIARLVNSKSQPPAGEAETPEQKADWLIKAYAENGEEAKAMVSDYNGSAEDAAEDFARDFIRARQSLITALKVLAPIDLNATREEGWISVEDRLPELPAGNGYSRSINVLVAWKGCTQPTEMAYAAYPGARSARGQAPRWEWQGRIAPWAVTHWRPIPDPPAFVQGIGGKP